MYCQRNPNGGKDHLRSQRWRFTISAQQNGLAYWTFLRPQAWKSFRVVAHRCLGVQSRRRKNQQPPQSFSLPRWPSLQEEPRIALSQADHFRLSRHKSSPALQRRRFHPYGLRRNLVALLKERPGPHFFDPEAAHQRKRAIKGPIVNAGRHVGERSKQVAIRLR